MFELVRTMEQGAAAQAAKLLFRRYLLHLLLVLPVLVVCPVPSITAQTSAPPNLLDRDDNQFWNETWLVIPLHKKVDLTLLGVFRAGRDFSLPVEERIGARIDLKLFKYVTFMPTYLYVAQQPGPGRKNFEHRLIPNVTVKFPLGKFNITDRNLFEWRVRHGLSDFLMYRNRLQIDHPARIKNFNFRIFVADEAWYNAERKEWVRNRVSAGIIKQFSERFAGEFFYLYQHDGLARPGNVNVIGTLFRIYM